MKYFKNYLFTFSLLFIFLLSSLIVLAKPKVVGSVPSIPSNILASNITSSSLILSWNSVSNATGYKVYRANPYNSTYSLIATVSATNFSNLSLSSSTSYWYFVRAYNSYGSSSDSTHLNITTSPIANLSKKLVLGYTTYYYAGDTSSYNSMTDNTSAIDEIATQTYTTDALGDISGLIPINQLTYAKSNGIKALCMITNNFDGSIAKTLLESSTNRQALINSILNAMTLNGYSGVNIDLEGIYYYDRSYFTTFMAELYNALNPKGFIITVAVPAKTSDILTDGWSGAFDYAQISKYASQIVLMTYDEHYPGGTAGPIASIGWVENVIKYAVTTMPTSKILLGTAAYGYDWSSSGTKAYGINGMYSLASTNNSTVLWDSVSSSPYFKYVDASGMAHSAWFENSASLGYKLDLINKYNLSGIAIWRLGLENSDYWTSIKTKFNR